MDKDGRFLMGLALATGLVASTVVGGRALVRFKNDNSIQVTGSAKRRIQSDLIIWSAKVSARGSDLKSAYAALAAATPKVTGYLEKKGLPKDQIVVSSVTTTALHPHDKDGRALEDTVTGYTMSQSIEVRSKEVAKVEKVSRESTELINEGVALESFAPEYHYTKLGDLKIQMLAEAAKDSRIRAEQVATSTGAKIGPLRSARMGVLQINPADSTETSNEGNNDTSSLEKDIIAVVASTFTLD
jgi:uncharacterized protein